MFVRFFETAITLIALAGATVLTFDISFGEKSISNAKGPKETFNKVMGIAVYALSLVMIIDIISGNLIGHELYNGLLQMITGA